VKPVRTATLRALHGSLALALSALLATYVVSGWLMIHHVRGGAASKRSVIVAVSPVEAEGAAVERVRAVAAEAARSAGLGTGHVEGPKFEKGAWHVRVRRARYSAAVVLKPGAHQARVTLREAPLAESIKRLHQWTAGAAGGRRKPWVLLVDALALALVAFACTGLWLFVRLKRDRRLGWLLLAASSLYTIGGIVWLTLAP
jgi:hypothetical protein